MLLVDEHIHMSSYRARIVADATIQQRMPPLQFIEYRPHAWGREYELSGALAVGRSSRGTWIVILFDRSIAIQKMRPKAARSFRTLLREESSRP